MKSILLKLFKQKINAKIIKSNIWDDGDGYYGFEVFTDIGDFVGSVVLLDDGEYEIYPSLQDPLPSGRGSAPQKANLSNK